MLNRKVFKVLRAQAPVILQSAKSSIQNSSNKSLSTSSSRNASLISDYRSDTLSQPTAEMREAMFNATVGDDSYKEDPTVNELEQRMAQMTGKEASLFVSSGTMSNLIAAMLHCSVRNSEIILGEDCHMHVTEQGGIAQVAGIHSRLFATKPDGSFDLEEVREKIREKNNMHHPITSMIAVENTHNRCGGTTLPLAFLSKAFEMAKTQGIPFHIDGARLTNAAVRLKVPLSEITQYCDSVSICFSKGLAAPMGSVLCGEKDFIEQAIHVRKVLGGGVRQSGFMAAAAIKGIERMEETLSKDHERAFKLAKCINDAQSSAVKINLELVHTNIVLAHTNPEVTTPENFCNRMATVTEKEKEELGEEIVVKIRPYGKNRVRFVICRNNSDEDIARTCKKLNYVLPEL